MATIERTIDGVLRRRWDTDDGYTAWDANGDVVSARDLTSDESAVLAARDDAADAAAVRASILDAMRAARDGNAVFLSVQAPAASEVVAQVRALTRQASGLIRLAANDLTGEDVAQ